jgi:hypothetical protein
VSIAGRGRCFVHADWSAMESWLTAFHSGDEVLLGELREQLAGGVKVHARNAALIYGIDAEDAETHLVNLKGRMVPAYNGGKRLSHAWNYGMGVRQGAQTFWVAEKFMGEVSEKLSAKYAGVMRYRTELANEVFGEPQFVCPRCEFAADDDVDCPECSRSVGVPIPLRFRGYVRQPGRIKRTVFGRHRHYPGRRSNGKNALASQDPQSCGASMWNVTFVRLHGWDPVGEQPWPAPEGILRYRPDRAWGELFTASEVFVATGAYDSFTLESPVEQAGEVLEWLLWTMEQPWRALGDWRFPAEGSIGGNLGKFDARGNRDGLKKIDSGAALTVAARPGWSRDLHVRELYAGD